MENQLQPWMEGNGACIMETHLQTVIGNKLALALMEDQLQWVKGNQCLHRWKLICNRGGEEVALASWMLSHKMW